MCCCSCAATPAIWMATGQRPPPVTSRPTSRSSRRWHARPARSLGSTWRQLTSSRSAPCTAQCPTLDRSTSGWTSSSSVGCGPANLGCWRPIRPPNWSGLRSTHCPLRWYRMSGSCSTGLVRPTSRRSSPSASTELSLEGLDWARLPDHRPLDSGTTQPGALQPQALAAPERIAGAFGPSGGAGTPTVGSPSGTAVDGVAVRASQASPARVRRTDRTAASDTRW